MIKTVYEGERGCGRKKAGGLYLIGGGPSTGCCKLPFPLTVCPCCNAGIKFSRGFTWITTDIFCAGVSCTAEGSLGSCVLRERGKRIGLMWVGDKYYSVQSFVNEGNSIGISKRIAHLPKDLVIGNTWVALAHQKAIYDFSDPANPRQLPGVFCLFRVREVQYVCRGDETDEQLTTLTDRGITPVSVQPITETQILDFKNSDHETEH